MKNQSWFLERIGLPVLRDGKEVGIEDYKGAMYYHSLQPSYKFEDKEPVGNICIACEG